MPSDKRQTAPARPPHPAVVASTFEAFSDAAWAAAEAGRVRLPVVEGEGLAGEHSAGSHWAGGGGRGAARPRRRSTRRCGGVGSGGPGQGSPRRAATFFRPRSDPPEPSPPAGEIGDTWVFGAASDPGKTARFRAVARAAAACAADAGCASEGPAWRNFTRLLLKVGRGGGGAAGSAGRGLGASGAWGACGLGGVGARGLGAWGSRSRVACACGKGTRRFGAGVDGCGKGEGCVGQAALVPPRADETPRLAGFAARRPPLQVPEHTWGADVKNTLRDTANYSGPAFLACATGRRAAGGGDRGAAAACSRARRGRGARCGF